MLRSGVARGTSNDVFGWEHSSVLPILGMFVCFKVLVLAKQAAGQCQESP